MMTMTRAERRRALGLRQSDVAKALGVSVNAIWAIEREDLHWAYEELLAKQARKKMEELKEMGEVPDGQVE